MNVYIYISAGVPESAFLIISGNAYSSKMFRIPNIRKISAGAKHSAIYLPRGNFIFLSDAASLHNNNTAKIITVRPAKHESGIVSMVNGSESFSAAIPVPINNRMTKNSVSIVNTERTKATIRTIILLFVFLYCVESPVYFAEKKMPAVIIIKDASKSEI